MPISPRSEAKGLQRLPSLKYYIVLKQESIFTIGLDASKITDYIKKSFKWKLLSFKFLTKKSVGAYAYLS